jgi:hypothetical protein
MWDEEVEELILGKGEGGVMKLVNEEGLRACVVRRDRWI